MTEEWPDLANNVCGREGCGRPATSAFDDAPGEFLYSCAAHRDEALAIVFARALGYTEAGH